MSTLNSRLDWRGDAVLAEVEEAVKNILAEAGLRAEGYAKKELRKGRGVLTGTLRRSIHTAPGGYNWSGDHVQPRINTPERGGKSALPQKTDKGFMVQVGSGLNYALAVHQGHGKFKGYHFITNGVDKARKDLPAIIAKYALKRVER